MITHWLYADLSLTVCPSHKGHSCRALSVQPSDGLSCVQGRSSAGMCRPAKQKSLVWSHLTANPAPWFKIRLHTPNGNHCLRGALKEVAPETCEKHADFPATRCCGKCEIVNFHFRAEISRFAPRSILPIFRLPRSGAAASAMTSLMP
jgi:hypothetical protein